MEQTITVSTDARGVARLVLNRPEKHNALNGAMMDEITIAANQLGADPAVRVVILGAEGSSFCAGGDLVWMRAQVAADARQRAVEARRLAGMLAALNTLPKPLIGQVQGNAFGGGIGMMAVCDLAIGVEGASFGLTETRLGLIAATISPYVVARIGSTAARRHMLGSRIFDASEACRIGLLAQATTRDGLDAAVEVDVRAFLECAPGAIAATKHLIRTLSSAISADVIERTIQALVERWESPEAGEGIAAFLARRLPNWHP